MLFPVLPKDAHQPEKKPIASPTGKYVAIDIEATSLKVGEARVIEIGAVLIDGSTITKLMDALCDPQEPISEKVTEITGITDSMVTGKPTFAQVLPELIAIIGDSPVVAHNARYDIPVIKAEADRAGLTFEPVTFDTLVMARRIWRGLPSFKLADLCEIAGISLDNAHRAVHDAEATAKLFIKLKGNE